jgi:hypothetical protein
VTVLAEFSLIGRLFAFSSFFGNDKIISHLRAPLVYSYDEALILAKSVLGYILGDFFTNSSGHTVAEEPANFFSEQN